MMTTLDQQRAGRRVARHLAAARGAEWLATMVGERARGNLQRRARELRDEHRAEMRDALRVVRCATVDDGRKGARA